MAPAPQSTDYALRTDTLENPFKVHALGLVVKEWMFSKGKHSIIIKYISWLLAGRTAREACAGIIQLSCDRETMIKAGIPCYEY